MITTAPFGLSEVGALAEVVIAPVHRAFGDQARLAAQWRDLNFTAEPDLSKAIAEYEAFVEHLRSAGATTLDLPASDEVSLDVLYARDASIVTPAGVVLCRMGKAQRASEPGLHGRAFRSWGVPVVGAIEAPGQLEGGDLFWLDERTVAVGRGYRTNDEGIRQLRTLLPPDIECLTVPLPHWRGPSDVFHLMSIVSPVDRDLAVVYAPLMPVPFRERLVSAGVSFVEVPDEEFESMGANVLALAPRRVLVIEGNPVTRRRLEAAGCEVVAYRGTEISRKGGGGPTCLTRPLRRRAIETFR
jgi:N-dimethylarginine dimethylaminohydrolase